VDRPRALTRKAPWQSAAKACSCSWMGTSPPRCLQPRLHDARSPE
jgi:hypothetical protein